MTGIFLFDDLRHDSLYDVCCFSEIGMRESQQDFGYLAAADNEVLAVICDGMGGMYGGEIASRTAVEKFVECYGQSDQANDCSWMETAVDIVDDVVYSLEDEEGNRLGAGTTLVAVSIKEKMMSWVSVGDSRLYVFRAGELLQITNDHNYSMQLKQQLESGEIDQSRYYSESYEGDALISYIGMGGLMLKDIDDTPIVLMKGDTVLLCSDGVYRTLTNENLERIFGAGTSANDMAIEIIKNIKSINAPEQDNYTCALININ